MINADTLPPMDKIAIKVIKRTKNNETAQIEAAPNKLKTESEINQEIAGEVKNWISERSFNSLTEKNFSIHKLHEWKLLP
ncbi:hypothetical protein BH10ACI1_BH10ACI1_27600 [soil metagenome]